jgi:hypothetical protein
MLHRQSAPWLLAGALALVSGVAACNGDEDDGGTDALPNDTGMKADGGVDTGVVDTGVDGGTDPFACDPGATAIPGGGRTGGAIAGTLNVFVLDFDDAPFAGATVNVSRGSYEATAVTGADGCLQFEDAALDGPTTIDVYVADRVYARNQDVNAAEITLVTAPKNAPPPNFGSISGMVTNLDVLGSTTATIAQFAAIDGFAPDFFTAAPMQAVRQGTQGVPTNLALVGAMDFDFRDYTSAVLPNTKGVSATAGLVSFNALGQPSFNVTHHGYLTNLDIGPGEMLTAQQIELTHPLDQALNVTVGAGVGLPNFGAFQFLEFPGDGFVFAGGGQQPRPANGVPTLPQVPALTGSAAGARYVMAVQETGPSGFSLIVEVGAGPNFAMGDLPPIPVVTVNGRDVSVTADARTEVVQYFVFQGQNDLLWVGIDFVPDNGSSSITIPMPPEGLDDIVAGNRMLVVRAIYGDGTIDFDEIDFSVTNPFAHIRGFLGAVQTVSF